MIKKLLNTFLLVTVFLMVSVVSSQEINWKKSEKLNLVKDTKLEVLKKDSYQLFELETKNFKKSLENAQLRNATSKALNEAVVSFPNIEGKLERFKVVETQVMAPELALKFPEIKTYVGLGIDNTKARVRFTVSPSGVQAMTSYLDKESVFTVPANKNDDKNYITYSKGTYTPEKEFECLTQDEVSSVLHNNSNANRDANDQTLRTFRLAVSTTGEYAATWYEASDTEAVKKSKTVAQVVSTVNRMNDVFEVDMAVTFQLIANNDNIVYTDASTDPYLGGSLNNELQADLTAKVGEANYDIGHVFDAGSTNGNAGCIGCVCEDGSKGSAFSSHNFNFAGGFITEHFDIDYVAHEVGHQMGANHTYSHFNEGTGVNYEPGSGSTIMGYAGITSSNVQNNSDPYFHYGSIKQILDNLVARTCFSSSAIANNPPVANAGNDYTIPRGTAFILKGAATDPDNGDNLTYTWEQIDDGTITRANFGATNTSGAMFRSRPPSSNPNRYMPVLSRVVANQLTETTPNVSSDNTTWETVSNVARTLNFALTVRDRSEANGTGQSPQSDFDLTTITVSNLGPFSVTSQVIFEAWQEGETRTIEWNVAGTTGNDMNVSTVTIKLSIDGGLTFPITLATGTPNDGSHDITVPEIGNTTIPNARVMVEADNHIFYAISNSSLSIADNPASIDDYNFAGFNLYPNPSKGQFKLQFDTVSSESASIHLFDIAGRQVFNKTYRNIGARFDEEIDIHKTAKGIYLLKMINGSKFTTRKLIIE